MNSTYKLVADNHRVFNHRQSCPAFMIVVNVGAADAATFHFYDGFPIGVAKGLLLDLYVFFAVHDAGIVCQRFDFHVDIDSLSAYG